MPQKRKNVKTNHNYASEKIREKYYDALKENIEAVKSGAVTKISISNGNIKMGEIPSESLLPLVTCPGLCIKTCGIDCYASKIANLRKAVINAYAKNTALYMLKPDLFWKQVNAAIAMSTAFRFHVSGDIPDKKYFAGMVQAAINNPHCKILAFTKRYEIVNDYIANNSPLPENLKILFSGWYNLKPVNPYGLPETAVIMPNMDEIPDSWKICGGNCFECKCKGVGCWEAKNGDTIAFYLH